MISVKLNITKMLAQAICDPGDCKLRNPDVKWANYAKSTGSGCKSCVLEWYKEDNFFTRECFITWLDKQNHLNIEIER